MKKVRLTFVAMLAISALALGSCKDKDDGPDDVVDLNLVQGKVSACIAADNSSGGDVPVDVVAEDDSDSDSDDIVIAPNDGDSDGDSDDIVIAPDDGNSDGESDDASSDDVIAPVPEEILNGFSWSYDAAGKKLTIKHDLACFECGWKVSIEAGMEDDKLVVNEHIDATLGTDCICARNLEVAVADVSGSSVKVEFTQDNKVSAASEGSAGQGNASVVFSGSLDLSKASGAEEFSAQLVSMDPGRCAKN